LIADGTVIGVVKKIEGGIVTIEVQSDGKIGEKKNMCLPGSSITLDTVTEVDMIDIVNFGLKYQVDQIAVSFARRGRDLEDLRRILI
jgi:pyruvate kinase